MKTIEDLIKYGIAEGACEAGLERAAQAKCFDDLKNWLVGSDWFWLLTLQPQLSDHCDWSKLGRYERYTLLSMHPQLAKHKEGNQL